MLVLVRLFVFEVVVALGLAVASSHRVGGFLQVVMEKAVAGFDEPVFWASNSPYWCYVQTRPANLATDAWDWRRLISPISAIMPTEYTLPMPGMEVSVFGIISKCCPCPAP